MNWLEFGARKSRSQWHHVLVNLINQEHPLGISLHESLTQGSVGPHSTPIRSCERVILRMPWENPFNFHTKVYLDSQSNWFDLSGQRSKVKVTVASQNMVLPFEHDISSLPLGEFLNFWAVFNLKINLKVKGYSVLIWLWEKNVCRLKLQWLVEAYNHRAVIIVSFVL